MGYIGADEEMLRRYLGFVWERHQVWIRRVVSRLPAPWTDDPALQHGRFLNMFRVLDHGSQFFVRDLAGSREDLLARAVLYRLTNRPEWWAWHRDRTGSIPTASEIASGEALTSMEEYVATGKPVFGDGYTIAAVAIPGRPKIESVNRKVQEVLETVSLEDLESVGFAGAVKTLSAFRGLGSFLSQQIVIDLGYGSPEFSENDVAFEGPGSIRGAAHIFGSGVGVSDAVQYLQNVHITEGSPSLRLPSGGTRPLSKTDVQNTLCEFDKFVRFADRASRPHKSRPNSLQFDPMFPRHW